MRLRQPTRLLLIILLLTSVTPKVRAIGSISMRHFPRKTNWETGAVYKEWIPLEFGSTERIKAFANSIGVNL